MTVLSVVEELLGGSQALGRRLRSDLDLADAVREGFAVRVISAVTGAGGALSLRELHRFIPRRTLEHRERTHGRLTPEQSDRLARLVRLTAMAEDTFGSREKARLWLRRSSRPLGDVAPLELLDSDAGAKAVEHLLGRIDHGLAA